MTTSPVLQSLREAPTPDRLLEVLRDIKNVLIGNTFKKVQVAGDPAVLDFLFSLLSLPYETIASYDAVQLDVICQAVIIIGSLSNVGSLTIKPLIIAGAPDHLVHLIHIITTASLPHTHTSLLLASSLRALRNLLVAVSDLLWGHVWGVGAEQRVVTTGLLGESELSNGSEKGRGGKGKASAERGVWKVEASRALSLIFEPDNLDTLMSVIENHFDPQILLPLYQLFSRLAALPCNRDALESWYSTFGPSDIPYILDHVLVTIAYATPARQAPGSRANPKLLEAGLELLASLVKGQLGIARSIRQWTLGQDDGEDEEQMIDPSLRGEGRDEVLSTLGDMIKGGPMAVRIAAMSCLVNIVKADKGDTPTEIIRLNVYMLTILDDLSILFKHDIPEDRVKLCFILAYLVSDDSHLQKLAFDRSLPCQVLTILHDTNSSPLGPDVSSRLLEASLLALASLAMQHEPTRSLIAENDPPVLHIIKTSLSHPSYGVRAAACQLARALSRTIAILRTSLVDSGVGQAVILTLKREVEAHRRREVEERLGIEEEIGTLTGKMGERAWTVEVAATATVCNLVADFSPIKAVLLKEDGLSLLAMLTHSTHVPLAINALWAIKNLTYHALEPLKVQVTSTLGFRSIISLMGQDTPMGVRVQVFEVVQNLLAEASTYEMTRVVEGLGEGQFMTLLELALRPPRDNLVSGIKKLGLGTLGEVGMGELGSVRDARDARELRIAGLYVLSNLALGGERWRMVIVNKVTLLENLSEALNSIYEPVKLPALLCFRHLIESTGRSKKPRSQMLSTLEPYRLRARVVEMVNSTSLDVCQAAVGLLDVLDKGKEPGSPVTMR